MMPNSIEELAEALGIDAAHLADLAATANSRYRYHTIPKANGTRRPLAEPGRDLKAIQRRLLDRVLNGVPLHPAATAYHRGASVVANASQHVGRSFVFSTDLVSFFPSVTEPRVKGLVLALGAPADVAPVIAKLTCFRGRLAQGAPSSPAIANLAARRLDLRIAGFCGRRGWHYTRYADDLTISGDGRFGQRDLDWVIRCVEQEGFEVNEPKTRLAQRHQAQVVTGVSVNGRCRLPREQRRKLRAMFHQASDDPAALGDRVEELRGHLGWLRAVEPGSSDLAEYERVVAEVLSVRAANW